MAEREAPQTIEEFEARAFAGEDLSGEQAPSVRRPIPPVGHFGYTEEDAEAVRQENKDRDATLATSEEKFVVGEPGAGDPVVDGDANTEAAQRAAAESAATASDTTTGESRESGGKRQRGRRDSTVAGGTDKNRQQAPAGQSRSGAESKGDDGDNSNNPGDESDKK